MINRNPNFSAGPSKLPNKVVERLKDEAFDYQGKGFAIFEISHRSDLFKELITDTKKRFLDLCGVKDTHQAIFLHGGANLQFLMIPQNFALNQRIALVNTGHWSQKTIIQAEQFAKVEQIASSQAENFSYIPKFDASRLDQAYLHLTSNNTIYGSQYRKLPKSNIPLVVDASSDILSQPFEGDKIDLAYGGAQKNFSLSGLGFALISNNFLAKAKADLPTMLSYKKIAESNSLFNTPNTFAIYAGNLTLQWIEAMGGLEKMEQRNIKKAKNLYEAIDNSKGFYQGLVRSEDRSLMNVTFRLADQALEQKFISEAQSQQLYFLKGHKAIGGLRASTYNSAELSEVAQLTDFMRNFITKNS